MVVRQMMIVRLVMSVLELDLTENVLISMSAVTTDLLEEHWHIVAATLTVRTPWGHSTATVTLALRTGKQMRGALILMSAPTHHGTIMLGKLYIYQTMTNLLNS